MFFVRLVCDILLFNENKKKAFNMRNAHTEMTKSKTRKQKKRQIHAHIDSTITEMMYCTEGKKRSYVCAYNGKKKRKKSDGKRKNLTHTG